MFDQSQATSAVPGSPVEPARRAAVGVDFATPGGSK
jgi:hypothetical protein